LTINLKDFYCYEVIPPEGAIYAVILVHTEKFKDVENTKDFCIKLLKKQNVFWHPLNVLQVMILSGCNIK